MSIDEITTEKCTWKIIFEEERKKRIWQQVEAKERGEEDKNANEELETYNNKLCINCKGYQKGCQYYMPENYIT